MVVIGQGKRQHVHFRDSGGSMTVTRKKSVQEVKCRIEDGSQDNKVSIARPRIKPSPNPVKPRFQSVPRGLGLTLKS